MSPELTLPQGAGQPRGGCSGLAAPAISSALPAKKKRDSTSFVNLFLILYKKVVYAQEL